MHYDVAAYGRDGNLSVVGEAKVRLATDREWAARLRNNILEHESGLRARYFVVAAPDRLYLWPGDAPPDALPEVINAENIFAPYFHTLGIGPSEIQPAAFENLVSWWLSDLARGDTTNIDPELRRSGLVDSLLGGRVSRELAA